MPRVVHFEIHAESVPRAIDFYKNVFGWKFDKWEGPMEYYLINTGDDSEPGIHGGLAKRETPSAEGQFSTGYVCTVDVDNLDDYIKKVEKNNGRIVQPKMAVPGVGWMCYCKDSESNIFGMMEEDENAK